MSVSNRLSRGLTCKRCFGELPLIELGIDLHTAVQLDSLVHHQKFWNLSVDWDRVIMDRVAGYSLTAFKLP